MSTDPVSLKRLGEEIRQVCRVVADEGKASVFSVRRSGERAIGEWLSTVRQSREAAAHTQQPVVRRRSRSFEESSFASSRGDLTRVHVMRVKGGRGTMQDAVVRTTVP